MKLTNIKRGGPNCVNHLALKPILANPTKIMVSHMVEEVVRNDGRANVALQSSVYPIPFNFFVKSPE